MRGNIAAFLAAATMMLEMTAPPVSADPVPVVEPVVIEVLPHDTRAYTEGLELDGSALYEGTGMAGESQLRELDPATGAVRRAVPVPNGYFGEGITVVGEHIWQLTYRDNVAVEWDRRSLVPIRQVPLAGENWGLCRDGNRLISSDGTDRLRFLDPETLADIGAVTVTRDGRPQAALNELECVDGQVWANVWLTDTIVRIDPATGSVTAVVDAGKLWGDGQRSPAQVLNGIAHVGGREFLLTGKYWPDMFRVRIDV